MGPGKLEWYRLAHAAILFAVICANWFWGYKDASILVLALIAATLEARAT